MEPCIQYVKTSDGVNLAFWPWVNIQLNVKRELHSASGVN